MKNFKYLIEKFKHLEQLQILEWYRGGGHCLHIKFGTNTHTHSLFLFGEWEIQNTHNMLSSVTSSTTEIDTYLASHKPDLCVNIHVDTEKRKVCVTFSPTQTLTTYQVDDRWFVYREIIDTHEYSYSPKKNLEVECETIAI